MPKHTDRRGYLGVVDGRYTFVPIYSRNGERHTCKLDAREHEELIRLFPRRRFVLKNGCPAIYTRTPEGDPIRLPLARVLDYILHRGSEAEPVMVKPLNGDCLDLTLANRHREPIITSVGALETWLRVEKIVEWRLDAYSKGCDPDQEAQMRWLERKAEKRAQRQRRKEQSGWGRYVTVHSDRYRVGPSLRLSTNAGGQLCMQMIEGRRVVRSWRLDAKSSFRLSTGRKAPMGC